MHKMPTQQNTIKERKKRKGLSIQTKKRIIEDVEAKLSYQKIADRYEIDKSTVGKIFKQREELTKCDISPTRTRIQAG